MLLYLQVTALPLRAPSLICTHRRSEVTSQLHTSTTSSIYSLPIAFGEATKLRDRLIREEIRILTQRLHKAVASTEKRGAVLLLHVQGRSGTKI